MRRFHGTPQYCALEVFWQEGANTFKADLWSLGVILFMMAVVLSYGRNLGEPRGCVLCGSYVLPCPVDPVLRDLLGWLREAHGRAGEGSLVVSRLAGQGLLPGTGVAMQWGPGWLPQRMSPSRSMPGRRAHLQLQPPVTASLSCGAHLHTPAERCVGCLHFLAIVNKAAVRIHVGVFEWLFGFS